MDAKTYAYDSQLSEQVNDRYTKEATLENFNRKAEAAQNALDRLADELDNANPDLVIVVGDDQLELFSLSNMPAFSIFYGDKLLTTGNPDADADLKLLQKLGMQVRDLRCHALEDKKSKIAVRVPSFTMSK